MYLNIIKWGREKPAEIERKKHNKTSFLAHFPFAFFSLLWGSAF